MANKTVAIAQSIVAIPFSRSAYSQSKQLSSHHHSDT